MLIKRGLRFFKLSQGKYDSLDATYVHVGFTPKDN